MQLFSFFLIALPRALANRPSQYTIGPSPTDTTITVPFIIPIPKSINTATGNVTVAVSSNGTLSITTHIRALNSLTTLSGTFDFSGVKLSAIGDASSREQQSVLINQAMTRKNILAGWAKTGLFPFNPERVLRDIMAPEAELSTAAAVDIRAPCEGSELHPQCEVVQTPVTPVSSEALTSIATLIK